MRVRPSSSPKALLGRPPKLVFRNCCCFQRRGLCTGDMPNTEAEWGSTCVGLGLGAPLVVDVPSARSPGGVGARPRVGTGLQAFSLPCLLFGSIGRVGSIGVSTAGSPVGGAIWHVTGRLRMRNSGRSRGSTVHKLSERELGRAAMWRGGGVNVSGRGGVSVLQPGRDDVDG